jgi:hypothetical protein
MSFCDGKDLSNDKCSLPETCLVQLDQTMRQINRWMKDGWVYESRKPSDGIVAVVFRHGGDERDLRAKGTPKYKYIDAVLINASHHPSAERRLTIYGTKVMKMLGFLLRRRHEHHRCVRRAEAGRGGTRARRIRCSSPDYVQTAKNKDLVWLWMYNPFYPVDLSTLLSTGTSVPTSRTVAESQ